MIAWDDADTARPTPPHAPPGPLYWLTMLAGMLLVIAGVVGLAYP